MAVDDDTVRRVARLAGLAIREDRVPTLRQELDGILRWAEMLQDVDVTGVPAMTSVVTQKLRMRADIVTDGNAADALMQNAPEHSETFFVVPKVVEQ